LDLGADFPAISNGHEWIFFRVYQTSKDWRELRAFVIFDLKYFAESFTDAHNKFSYTAIIDESSLRRLLLDTALAHRELFYPKDKISAYDATVDSNNYASSLRPIAERYFGTIDAADFEFMESCYVSDREYDLAFTHATRHIEDAVTPFLSEFKIRDFLDNQHGGGFGKRVSKNVVGIRPADVIVLFGGKGVGKSTFLRRLLLHKPPHLLQKNGVVVMVDLIDTPPDADEIRKFIWNEIATVLDVDNILSGSRDDLCALFADRYEQARNQDLYGIDERSEAFNLRLNALIKEWKADYPYMTRCLAERIRARHKAVVINVDNTDQYDEPLQELCFSIARSIASAFPCVVIISMREERFYASSIKGVLDAYQNSGFHITSPEPREVFLRRIRYVRELLDEGDIESSAHFPARTDLEAVSNFFRILDENFRLPASHLANFLAACSHGNIRLALELFRGFVVSGYTNVREMTASRSWTLQMHQVIKPFMIPKRFFYSESLSKIPNVFQLRSKIHGSHFTALRILDMLISGSDKRNPPFVPIAKLAMPFIEVFAMREDFQLNIDVLLKHGLIESNNRLETFSEEVDSLRVTTYGLFAFNVLARDFTYLELAAEDSAIWDLAVANEITELSNDEYRHFLDFEAMERVEVRLRRAEVFLKYLAAEEERERQLFHAAPGGLFTDSMQQAFASERKAVLRSARRNVPKKRYFRYGEEL